MPPLRSDLSPIQRVVACRTMTAVHAAQAVKAMEAIEHVLCDMPSSTTVGVVSISLLSSVPFLYNDHILHPPPHAATTNH